MSSFTFALPFRRSTFMMHPSSPRRGPDVTFILLLSSKYTVDLSTTQSQFNLSKTIALTFGSAANQANMVFTDTRSTAGAEDLDVSGGALTDAFGVVYTIARMKALVVCASTANTTNVVLGGDAASVPFLSTAATTTTLKPGGCFVLTDPSATGVVVTATSADIIQVAPSSGTVAYDILIIGASS